MKTFGCTVVAIVIVTTAIANSHNAKPKRSTDPVAATISMPSDEQLFVVAVQRAHTAYDNGSNEMQKGAQRLSRKREMCSALGGYANNWVGTVTKLSSNGDGKGVLSIQLAEDVTVSTWNNSFSDLRHQTLLDPSSNLFSKVSSMAVGDKVRFSGSLFSGDADCFAEMSMTIAGAMTSPEFVMRFSDVERL